uniref:Small ribosomal subunit protein mS40 n=1 Tax=Amazona collaria TaxID=241587 RepID=A0A8B9F6L9_9PSIT
MGAIVTPICVIMTPMGAMVTPIGAVGGTHGDPHRRCWWHPWVPWQCPSLLPAPGVCMKQHKLLSKAIAQAQDHGLLWLQVPFVPTPQGDFSNRHPAVGRTPPAPAQPWYPWYEWQPPPAAAVARIRRIYRNYLKGEATPAVLPPRHGPASSSSLGETEARNGGRVHKMAAGP